MNPEDNKRSRRLTLVTAAGLFLGLFLLRQYLHDPTDGVLALFILPIILLAFTFGLPGGLGGAAVAIALFALWALSSNSHLSALGYATRIVLFASVGAVVGALIDQRRAREGEQTRWFDLSLDRPVSPASPASSPA